VGETTPVQIRVPRKLWEAAERVYARRGTTRAAAVIEHLRRDVKRYGDDQDRADLAEADAELTRPRPGPKRRTPGKAT
jgi:hypothetical protein